MEHCPICKPWDFLKFQGLSFLNIKSPVLPTDLQSTIICNRQIINMLYAQKTDSHITKYPIFYFIRFLRLSQIHSLCFGIRTNTNGIRMLYQLYSAVAPTRKIFSDGYASYGGKDENKTDNNPRKKRFRKVSHLRPKLL